MRLREFIAHERNELIRCWTRGAERAASARGLSRPELLDIMPALLDSIGLVSRAPERLLDAQQRLIETHVGGRLRLGFDLSEVVRELGILGRCVSDAIVGLPAADRPPADEIAWLFEELHLAAAAVTRLFTEHLLEDEQREKRYGRLLDEIASNALATPDSGGFRDHLREALEIVMEATDTRTAALLLYDPDTEHLVVTASAGIASDAITRNTASLAPISETTELAVSEELRRGGIRALLGVRLAPRHQLWGVLYAGASTRDSFAASERRRLQVLGDRFLVHLDNARLFAELQGQIRILRREREYREGLVNLLAHDIRGPLSVATLAADLMVRTTGPAPDLAARIAANLSRADRMLTDLLDAHLVAAGERLTLQLAECDLAKVVRDVASDVAQIHGARIVVDADQDVRGLWSERELRRAIWNLATNAVQYGAQGAPVSLRLRRHPWGAELSIHNSGVPIAPEDRQDLFRPFFRSHGAARDQAGWGLGLALVRGAAEAHGGSVEVTSATDTGTTFTLKLPWDARSPEHAPQTPAANSP